jgi:hypothetical protein
VVEATVAEERQVMVGLVVGLAETLVMVALAMVAVERQVMVVVVRLAETLVVVALTMVGRQMVVAVAVAVAQQQERIRTAEDRVVAEVVAQTGVVLLRVRLVGALAALIP